MSCNVCSIRYLHLLLFKIVAIHAQYETFSPKKKKKKKILCNAYASYTSRLCCLDTTILAKYPCPTRVLVRPLKSIPDECSPFLFFFLKKFWVRHRHDRDTLESPKHSKTLKWERERERVGFGPTPLSFPQFSDLICVVCLFGVDQRQPNPFRHPTTLNLLLSHSAISLFAGFRFSVFWAFDSFFLCFFLLFFFFFFFWVLSILWV